MCATATERWSDRKLTVSADGKWTASMAWDVIDYTDEMDAIAAVPMITGAAHPRSGSLTCTNISIQSNKITLATITAQFAVSSSQGSASSPLTQLPLIAWKRARQTKPIDTDVSGNPIVNSAADAFGSNPSKNFSVRHLSITRYEPYYDQKAADMFVDTVNSGTVTFEGNTFGAGQVYCDNIAPTETYSKGAKYVKIGYEFEIRTPSTANLTPTQKRHPFQLRVLDQGQRGIYTDPADSQNKYGKFYFADKTAASKDIALNGSGTPADSSVKVTANGYSAVSNTLASNVIIDNVSVGSQTLTFLTYMIYAEADFSGIGIHST